MVLEEAQLYTDGSSIPEGNVTLGDFHREKETTRSTGGIVGTDDGDTYQATRVSYPPSSLLSSQSSPPQCSPGSVLCPTSLPTECAIKTLEKARAAP